MLGESHHGLLEDSIESTPNGLRVTTDIDLFAQNIEKGKISANIGHPVA